MNSSNSDVQHTPRRSTHAAAYALIFASLLSAPAWAQATSQPVSVPRRSAVIAATEDRLWIARIEQGQTAISYRDIGGAIQDGPMFKGAVIRLIAAGDEAYAMLSDGGFFRCFDTTSETAAVLPGRTVPIDVIDVEEVPRHVLYAVVESSVARDLNAYDAAAGIPMSQPFEPGDAALSIVRYGREDWTAVTACPAGIGSETVQHREARLAHDGNDLLLFWRVQPNQIGYVRWDRIEGHWQSGGTIPAPGLQSFWVTMVNRLPTLVARSLRDGKDIVTAFRLVNRDPVTGDHWVPCELQLSTAPETAAELTITAAIGFNQHVALLETGGGRAFVRFGRCDGPAAIPTLDVFAATRNDQQSITLLQLVQMTVLLVIIAFLLAFRRGAIVTAIPLPPDRSLALTLPRLTACLLDLVPFVLVTAFFTRVSLDDAINHLTSWAFPRSGEPMIPPVRILAWWALSVGGYSVYALLMELTRQSTLAKRALGMEIISENGKHPTFSQVLVRNVMRFIELMPPFWIMGFVVLLSRNRQRIGDIFARTVAVRRVELPDHDESKPKDDE